jgi:hypothetical protein
VTTPEQLVLGTNSVSGSAAGKALATVKIERRRRVVERSFMVPLGPSSKRETLVKRGLQAHVRLLSSLQKEIQSGTEKKLRECQIKLEILLEKKGGSSTAVTDHINPSSRFSEYLGITDTSQKQHLAAAVCRMALVTSYL